MRTSPQSWSESCLNHELNSVWEFLWSFVISLPIVAKLRLGILRTLAWALLLKYCLLCSLTTFVSHWVSTPPPLTQTWTSGCVAVALFYPDKELGVTIPRCFGAAWSSWITGLELWTFLPAHCFFMLKQHFGCYPPWETGLFFVFKSMEWLAHLLVEKINITLCFRYQDCLSLCFRGAFDLLN